MGRGGGGSRMYVTPYGEGPERVHLLIASQSDLGPTPIKFRRILRRSVCVRVIFYDYRKKSRNYTQTTKLDDAQALLFRPPHHHPPPTVSLLYLT